MGRSSAIPLDVGIVLGNRYEIEAVIGEGGAGRVFRAVDRVLGEKVALKVLRPERTVDRSWIRRLAREVKVARAIRHANVCRVYELGWAEGHRFITMELATRGTLRDLLNQRIRAAEAAAPSPNEFDTVWPERLIEARALCAGLAAIHAVGIVHRDVTPQNVLVMSDGRLVVSDFGLAVGAAESTTFHGGTPQYMAPEVLAGERATQRSDVWQLGMILHEILFGRRPEWGHDGERVFLKRLVAEDASVAEHELATLCASCMSHAPEARPENAVAVGGLLAAAEQARPRSRAARAWLHSKRFMRRTAVQLAVVAIAVAATVGQAVRVAVRPRRCHGGPDRVVGIWDGPRRETVHRAFLATGRPQAATTFVAVSEKLDNYLARWLATYEEACEATHVRGEQSSEMFDLRMTCLTDNLESVRALTRIFSEASADVVNNGLQATTSLPDLARCSNIYELRAAAPLPTNPERRRAIEDLRRRIGEANRLKDAGRFQAAVQVASDLVARARSLGFRPALAEAFLVLGESQLNLGQTQGRPTLEEALWTAEAAAVDRVAAEAAIELMDPLRDQDFTVSSQWANLARSKLDRLGGDPRLESWFLNDEGNIHYLKGDYLRGLESVNRAIALKESFLGPDHPDVAISLDNAAVLLGELGRTSEAIAANERALRIHLRWYGEDSVATAMTLSNQGDIRLVADQKREAEIAYRRSLLIFEHQTSSDSVLRAYPLAGLGRTMVRDGRAVDAVSLLQRAFILNAHVPDVPFAVNTQFYLGRALYESDRDPNRGLELAKSALARCSQISGPEARQREIQKWLSTHPRR
jgi:serine/threonine-protein kinase